MTFLEILIIFTISVLLSAILTYVILQTSPLHQNYTADYNFGPQKFHKEIIIRIGGVSIFLSLGISLLIYCFFLNNYYVLFILICATPPFFAGLVEDVTNKTSTYFRILTIVFSSIIAFIILPDLSIRTDIRILDNLLTNKFINIIIVIFSTTGLTNSFNIIDGFNGLASMVAILILSSIAIVSHINNDQTLVILSLLMIGCIIGFLYFNYPNAYIFLGDNGAYFIGFYIAIISILLVKRNNNVSAFYALIVNIYPIFETLFSIWRRKISKKRKLMDPDGMHLHSLIFRRVLRWENRNKETINRNNAKTTRIILFVITIFILPSTIWFDNQIYLSLIGIVFCLIYVHQYHSIAKFKKWRF